MKRGILGAVAVLSLCGAPAAVRAQEQVASRDVRLREPATRELQINQIETSKYPRVNIFATVLSNGTPMTGLTAKDFKIREDEVDQEPITVEPQLVPLSVVLTLDTSGSMSKAIAKAKEAAQSFLDSLEKEDNAAVLSFNRSVNVVAAPGSTREAAKGAIGTLVARGDTALFDALYASLESVKAREGRRAIVLLSDGVDDDGHGKVLSTHTVDQVISLAKESNVPVFTIGLGTELDEPTLKRVAAESGGKYYTAPTVEELQALYAGLGKQLSGQYHIHYDSNLPADGTPHTIQVASGELRSSKTFTAPVVGGAPPAPKPAPAVPPPAPVAAQAGQPLNIAGGASPETAPLLPTNVMHTVRNPSEEGGEMKNFFLAFEAKSGEYFTVLASMNRAPKHSDCPKIIVLNPRLEQYMNRYDCDSNAELKLSTIVTDEGAGKWYLQVLQIAGGQVGIYTSPADDAGSGRDAGQSDARAIDLQPGVPVTGVISEDLDSIDAYRFPAKKGVEYQVRVRPDLRRSVEIKLFNEDGEQLANKTSQNVGAGVTLPFKVDTDGSVTISVKAHYNSEDGVGRYALVAGEGVSAPPQPEELKVQNLLPESVKK